MKTAVILWSLAMLLLVTEAQFIEQERMTRPERPKYFQNDEDVKQYLGQLKSYLHEVMKSGRYGKRNYVQPNIKYNRNHLNQMKWKNDYDYYSQYNI